MLVPAGRHDQSVDATLGQAVAWSRALQALATSRAEALLQSAALFLCCR
jgi:hypothetical protein